MDKKVYNKPSLNLEVFTPNEYIASCWYIAEGDCLNGIIYKDVDDSFQKNDLNNMDKWNLSGHDEHRVPESGYFRDEGPNAVTPDSQQGGDHWYYGRTISGINNNKPQKWLDHGFHPITTYYKVVVDGTTHYFEKISKDQEKINAVS